MSEIKPKVAIIILNWNRPKDTVDCLASLAKLNTKGWQPAIYVVDNGSTDNSIEQFKKIKKPDFSIVENGKNLGFAQGNNEGMKVAIKEGADYVIVLNNDTVVDKDLVMGILKGFIKDRNIGVLCPKIYFASGFEFHKDRYKKDELGKVIWYAGGNIDWNNIYASNHGVDQVDTGQFDKQIDTDFATGCCMVAKREVLKKIGYFDERYFMYLEDVEYSQRAREAGFRVVYSPYGILWHKVAQSSGIGGGLNDYFISRNRLLFGYKHASFRTKLALFRESIKLLLTGREWQKKGVRDYYIGRLGKGSKIKS